MSEIIITTVFALLAILGLCEVLHTVKVYIISPKKREEGIYLVCLKDENAPLEILTAVQKRRWYGNGFAGKIVAVDCGLNEKTADDCRFITKKSDIVFCDKNELLSEKANEIIGM